MTRQRPPDAPNLKGLVYRGTDPRRPVPDFVVLKDDGGDSVWVEPVEPPHRARSIKRDRLFTYHYELVGRQHDGSDIVDLTPAPVFDGPRFGQWLRRWMQAENITMPQLARRSGVSVGMLQQVRAGLPTSSARARGQTTINPGINTLAGIAHGLGLQFSYVAAKAGLSDAGDRWQNFSPDERLAIAVALDGDDDPQALDRRLAELVSPPQRMKEKV